MRFVIRDIILSLIITQIKNNKLTMASNQNHSESSLLLQYETALENATTQTEISALMAEFGYDESTLAGGKSLLSIAQTEYGKNLKEDQETRASAKLYKDKSKEIYDKFRLDRKKAKVVFRNSVETLQDIGCLKSIPNSWANRIDTYEKFYNTALNGTAIKDKLSRLKITEQDLQDGVRLIEEAKQSRFDYYKEVGESEQATKEKDKALSELDDWMTEFYMVAKIALEDKPQLMESLGRSVKS